MPWVALDWGHLQHLLKRSRNLSPSHICLEFLDLFQCRLHVLVVVYFAPLVKRFVLTAEGYDVEVTISRQATNEVGQSLFGLIDAGAPHGAAAVKEKYVLPGHSNKIGLALTLLSYHLLCVSNRQALIEARYEGDEAGLTGIGSATQQCCLFKVLHCMHKHEVSCRHLTLRHH